MDAASPQGPPASHVYPGAMEEKPPPPDRSPQQGRRERPPGDFTSEEFEADTARFLDELRRRAEKQRHTRRRLGPPPPTKPV